MDRRERMNDPEEALRAALDGKQATMWTALPGIVVGFNPDAMTVTVQPAIQGTVQAPDGSRRAVALPVLPDVPVVFMGGGGLVATFPIAAGDEALVVFSSRCIDGWWQSGGVQRPMEARMHDLSDGFAIIGPRSQARKIPDISTTAAQLRTEDGENYVELTPEGKVRIEALDIEFHARRSLKTDVNGYGEKLEHVEGTTWKKTTWQAGATIETETLPINPPEGPPETP